MHIINDDTKTPLTTKFPRTLSPYLLPKIHETSNQGQPIVNIIGSITQKLSEYVDGHIRLNL